jgi:hypothetical protein
MNAENLHGNKRLTGFFINLIILIVMGKLTSAKSVLFSSDTFLRDFFFRFGVYLHHNNSHHQRFSSRLGDTDKDGIIILNWTLEK